MESDPGYGLTAISGRRRGAMKDGDNPKRRHGRAIRVFMSSGKGVDARAKPGHDGALDRLIERTDKETYRVGTTAGGVGSGAWRNSKILRRKPGAMAEIGFTRSVGPDSGPTIS